MPDRRVDAHTRYDPALSRSSQREIERPDVELVLHEHWPTQTMFPEPYLPSNELIDAVNLAITLRRPLLLQGDPGCGKTRLAYAVAYTLGLPLETCYIKSTSRAQDLLYSYDAISRLYDAQLGAEGPQRNGEPLCRNPDNYIRLAPLGRAIVRAAYGRPSVVLIDEIDKADLDFPNDLLRELDRLEFEIPETRARYSAGDDPAAWPIVIVTNNEEKPLPNAFLRRCIFHVLHFPEDPALLQHILDLHEPEASTLSARAIEIVLQLRQLDLTKRPGVSELIDWVAYHHIRGTNPNKLKKLPGRGALLKQQADQKRVEREWKP